MEVIVGVLALQGAFAKHLEMLNKLGVKAIEVRRPQELAKCSGLIIPGGESTTITKQLAFSKLAEEIALFGKKKPLFGTCAGMILMSNKILSDDIQPYGFIDIDVERNAFGRQVESFQAEITITLPQGKKQPFKATFIRAPRIRRVGADVEVLASINEEPILVKQSHHLAASFHPELGDDPLIHNFFVKGILKACKDDVGV